MPQRKRTELQLRDFLQANVSFRDWIFLVQSSDSGIVCHCDEGCRDECSGRPYLQVAFWAHDTDDPPDGPVTLQKGRKWFLSPYMTDTELVRTAYKAVVTAMEHEVQENFRYKESAIFNPHTDVESLRDIAHYPKDVRE